MYEIMAIHWFFYEVCVFSFGYGSVRCCKMEMGIETNLFFMEVLV